jgi:hypothetical protein
LISLAHRIGHENACAQAKDIPRLRAHANAAVNAGRIPPQLQEPLLSAVAALDEQTPLCVPAAPASVTTTPEPVVVAPRPHGHPKKHGHPKHGKHKK